YGAPPPGTVVLAPGLPSHGDVAAALGLADAAAGPVPQEQEQQAPQEQPPQEQAQASQGQAEEAGEPEPDAEAPAMADAEDAPPVDAIADAPVDAPRQLVDLGFEDVEAAMSPCRERGAVRLRY